MMVLGMILIVFSVIEVLATIVQIDNKITVTRAGAVLTLIVRAVLVAFVLSALNII